MRAAKSGKGTPLSSITADGKIRIIIRLDRRFGLKSHLKAHSYTHLAMESVEATPAEVQSLLTDPVVTSVSLDRPMSATSIPLDVNGPSVGADVAGEQVPGSPTLNGAGVNVAVIDSGVAPVDDIVNHIVGFVDFVNGQTDPYDDYGHGTHVAGIIAGDGTDSSGSTATKMYQGIAPGSGIVGVKVLDSNGNGYASNIIAGIDWCIGYMWTYGIGVINLSLTGDVDESFTTDPVCQAADAASMMGLVVVVSAGNNGGTYGYVGSPANDPNVITVGASNDMQTADRSDDIITTYTSRGPTEYDLNVKPDLVAPGNKIVSLRVPGSTLDQTDSYYYVDPSVYLSGDTSSVSSAYAQLSGTSMSAPAVSAAAALMLEQNSSLTPNAVKQALMYSAQLLSGYDPVLQETVTYDPLTQGAGELNIPGAIQLANMMSPSGLSGTPTGSSPIAGTSIPWGGPLIGSIITNVTTTGTFWGDPAVWSAEGMWAEDQSSFDWAVNTLNWGGGEGSTLTWQGNCTWDGDTLHWGGGKGDTLDWTGDTLHWGGGKGDSVIDGDTLHWGGGKGDAVWEGGTLHWGGGKGDSDPGGDTLHWGGGKGDTLHWGGGKGDTLHWGGGKGDNVLGGDTLHWGGGKGDCVEIGD